MNALTIQIPDSIYTKLLEFATREHVSIEEYVSGLTTKLFTIDYLEERARRANLDRWKILLDKVADVEPDERDKR